MSENSTIKSRCKELRQTINGKYSTEWQLTDTKQCDIVRLKIPPPHAIPIIFVPGIMGSNLCNLDGHAIWLLDRVGNVPLKLAWDWSTRKASERQKILHPRRAKVYDKGAVPKGNASSGLSEADFLARGWGQVSEASYHKFLLWLDKKMNGDRDPLEWTDFSDPDIKNKKSSGKKNLRPGIVMQMDGLPEFAEHGVKVPPVTSDELLKRSKSVYPIYAFGYNWLDNNEAAATRLKNRINDVIKENNVNPVKCTQVILVTHSMGGLVARACSQLQNMQDKILGIVHGVMPATGAAVAYRRCKVGMLKENIGAGLVIGSSGKEVTAVFAQSPGALQLLPSESYGKEWLQVIDNNNKKIMSLPIADPYEEIYLKRNYWWSLINEDWLRPSGGMSIDWGEYEKNIRRARDFHCALNGKYHGRTFAIYGGGREKKSYEKVTWKLRRGTSPVDGKDILSDKVVQLNFSNVRTDGSNRLYVGGKPVIFTSTRGDSSSTYIQETSFWEINCLEWDSEGDGTVPVISGRDPKKSSLASIVNQFELADVEHEPAFRHPNVQTIAYYAITKLAAAAERS